MTTIKLIYLLCALAMYLLMPVAHANQSLSAPLQGLIDRQVMGSMQHHAALNAKVQVLALSQIGDGNYFYSTQYGSGNRVYAVQHGRGHSAHLTQVGSDNMVLLAQYGDAKNIMVQQFGHQSVVQIEQY